MNWFDTTTNADNSIRPEPPDARDGIIPPEVLSDLKAEIERLKTMNAEQSQELEARKAEIVIRGDKLADQAQEIKRLRALEAGFLNDYGTVLNAANIAEARVETLEGLLREWMAQGTHELSCSKANDSQTLCDCLYVRTEDALAPQPQKEAPHA